MPTPEWFICDIRSLLLDCAKQQLILGALFLHNVTPMHVIIMQYLSISAFLKYDECMFVPLELWNPGCAPDLINYCSKAEIKDLTWRRTDSCWNNWSTVSWQSLHLEFLIFKMILSSSLSKRYLKMLRNVVRWQVNLTKGISTYTSLLKREAGCLQHCFAAFFGLQIFFFRGLNFITSLF